MKRVICSFLMLIIIHLANAQTLLHKPLHLLTKPTDTIFLERQKLDHSYHAVYIERNRRSVDYKYLSDFSINKLDRYSFGESLNTLSKKNLNGPNLKGNRPFNTLGKYLPLYVYKNKLYLYSPCDYMNVGRIMLNDRILVKWFEEPYPARIKSINRLKDNTVNIVTYDYLDYHKLDTYSMKLLNKKSKIILLTEILPNYSSTTLYIPTESAKQFDIIVNKCEGEKSLEFDFVKVSEATLIELAKHY